jgi:hypothetical protein
MVKYRDSRDAVENTVNIYINIAKRKKKRMILAENEATEWERTRDELKGGKQKRTYNNNNHDDDSTRDHDNNEDDARDLDNNEDDESSNALEKALPITEDDNESSDELGEEERNNVGELVEPLEFDLRAAPSLEAIAQLTDDIDKLN